MIFRIDPKISLEKSIIYQYICIFIKQKYFIRLKKYARFIQILYKIKNIKVENKNV